MHPDHSGSSAVMLASPVRCPYPQRCQQRHPHQLQQIARWHLRSWTSLVLPHLPPRCQEPVRCSRRRPPEPWQTIARSHPWRRRPAYPPSVMLPHFELRSREGALPCRSCCLRCPHLSRTMPRPRRLPRPCGCLLPHRRHERALQRPARWSSLGRSTGKRAVAGAAASSRTASAAAGAFAAATDPPPVAGPASAAAPAASPPAPGRVLEPLPYRPATGNPR
mmetsp:Transcript_21978/g.61218  ORF Transcript_21978/g.61218 Transcript_21978/m.61218 type:complete len:221 (+) Transcript_21978:123-785(+)